MLEALTTLGLGMSVMTLLILVLFCYLGNSKTGGLWICWNCPNCGKMNETNLISYILKICDHQGIW